MKKGQILSLIILLVLVADQCLKFYIKTNYSIGGGFNILGLDWARIHFVENRGMAFGLSFGGVIGKYILSGFRIIMVGFLIYFLRGLMKTQHPFGLQISFALIIAGAIGNIIDSMFYGLLFSESCFHCGVAEFLPAGGGYAGFLQGSVVDIFYFPMIDTRLPEWIPLIGGNEFAFFKPVFNIADSSISIGVALILIFYRSFFIGGKKKAEGNPEITTQEI